MKTVVDFQTKLVEYGLALREYNAARAVYLKTLKVADEKRVDLAAKELDRLRGPMHTALDRLAQQVI